MRVLRLIKKDGYKKGGQFSDKVHNSIEYIFYSLKRNVVGV